MRSIDRLYDTTSASGGALDTGVLNTSQYDALLALYIADGGSPTGCTASVVLDDGATAVEIASLTPGGTSIVLFNWQPTASGTPAIPALVPRQVKFNVGAIAAQLVRLIVYGRRSASGAN